MLGLHLYYLCICFVFIFDALKYHVSFPLNLKRNSNVIFITCIPVVIIGCAYSIENCLVEMSLKVFNEILRKLTDLKVEKVVTSLLLFPFSMPHV